MHSCRFCKQEYTPMRSDSIYCSDECWTKNRNKRLKDERRHKMRERFKDPEEVKKFLSKIKRKSARLV